MELFKHYVINSKYIYINDYTGILVNGWKQNIYYNFSMKQISTYLDDQYHGIRRKLHKNGKLHSYYNMVYGNIDGLEYNWYKNGYIKDKCDNNRKRRRLYRWNYSRMIKSNIYVVDGKLDGSPLVWMSLEEIHKRRLYYKVY